MLQKAVLPSAPINENIPQKQTPKENPGPVPCTLTLYRCPIYKLGTSQRINGPFELGSPHLTISAQLPNIIFPPGRIIPWYPYAHSNSISQFPGLHSSAAMVPLTLAASGAGGGTSCRLWKTTKIIRRHPGISPCEGHVSANPRSMCCDEKGEL